MEHADLSQEMKELFPVEMVDRIGKRKAKDGKTFTTVVLKNGARHRYEVKEDGTYVVQSVIGAGLAPPASEQIPLPEVGESVPEPLAEPEFEADVLLA